MRTLVITIFVLLSLFSCSDDTYHTVVKGQVVNYGSRQPVDSVLVRLNDGVAAGNAWLNLDGTYSEKVDCTYTNENGYFELELEGDNRAVLWATKEGYIKEEFLSYPDGMFEDEVIELQADAWFDPVIFTKYAAVFLIFA